MTLASLVIGARASLREAAIASRVSADQSTAVILEGLPDGSSALDASHAHPDMNIARIAPGCMHCIGNLVMRVTLNRMLRNKPQRLFVSVANTEHLEQLRAFLTTAPYDALLQLTPDIKPDDISAN
jgi:hypothetical protein